MRIWKFPLAVVDRQMIEMPINAGVLCVQTQNDEPQLWAMCDENSEVKEHRCFLMFGTGNPVPEEFGFYVDTFQMMNGSLVFHVFEEME
jgi:hypothetical protein